MRSMHAMISRVFPAHAGMSPHLTSEDVHYTGFPRTRGDEPGLWNGVKSVATFSPHTRG